MQRKGRAVREPARRGHSGGSGDRSCTVGSGGDSSTDLKVSVPAGSVQSAKGEASDEDEETEYFDAMEDAPAFITVTADPKHHRYHPRPAWEWGKGWEEPVFLQQPLPWAHSMAMSS